MKRMLALLLALTMGLSLAACAGEEAPVSQSGTESPAPAESAEPSLTPAPEGARTVTATRPGFGGDISVTLTVEDGKITAASATGENETEGIGSRAVAELPAALAAAGNLEIDGISGATVSSNALLAAARMAYNEATGAGNTQVRMKPGTYTASALGYWQIWELPVTITVNETSLLSISVPQSREENGETEGIMNTVEELLFPRMIEQQSVTVDAITGCTVTSNTVKTAVEKALVEALIAGGSDPSAISNFYRTSEKSEVGVTEEIETDILVVGLGTGGVLAMKAASERLRELNGNTPARVLGIEKCGKLGGQSVYTHSPNAVNPPMYQEEFNGGEPLVDYDEYLNDWLEYTKDGEGNQRAKEELVRLFFDESGNTIDWLMYKQGLEFGSMKNSTDFSDTGFNTIFYYFAATGLDKYYDTNEDRRAVMEAFYEKLLTEVECSGGGYMLETEGYEYLYDEAAGAVTGVKARNLVTGKEYIIHAKAVISATGGFGGSEELMDELLDPRWAGQWFQNGNTAADGKMIRAALDIGAGTYNADMPPITMEISLPYYLKHFPINFVEGKKTNRTGRQTTWTFNDIPLYMCVSVDTLAVDRNGARFGNEWGIGNNIGDEVPPIAWKVGPYFYSIWSQGQVDNVAENGFNNVFRTVAYCQQGGLPLNTPTPEIYEAMEACVEQGLAWKADTLEELAGLTGMDAATLAATVARYDELCAAGEDADFGKDAQYMAALGEGPYYAIKAMPAMYGSGGALDVDVQLRVLRTDGATPIHGLYAVGQDSFGVIQSDEKNYIGYGGVCQGWVITSGRMSGLNAADYAWSLTQQGQPAA